MQRKEHLICTKHEQTKTWTAAKGRMHENKLNKGELTEAKNGAIYMNLKYLHYNRTSHVARPFLELFIGGVWPTSC